MSSDDIFAEHFGFSSPFGGMSGGGSTRVGSMFDEDIFGSTFGASTRSQAPQKAALIEKPLPCSLEELYKGTTKKLKISREILGALGKRIVEEILTIDVKPGWKKGTKITFSEKGNESPNVVPADIAFIIDEKPHPLFSREGNDLITTQKISLAEALTGYTAPMTTLDGRSLAIPISKVIHPGYQLVVAGEGMPFPKDPSRRGNLCIKFYIKFPTRLTAEQKALVKRALVVEKVRDELGGTDFGNCILKAMLLKLRSFQRRGGWSRGCERSKGRREEEKASASKSRGMPPMSSSRRERRRPPQPPPLQEPQCQRLIGRGNRIKKEYPECDMLYARVYLTPSACQLRRGGRLDRVAVALSLRERERLKMG